MYKLFYCEISSESFQYFLRERLTNMLTILVFMILVGLMIVHAFRMQIGYSHHDFIDTISLHVNCQNHRFKFIRL